MPAHPPRSTAIAKGSSARRLGAIANVLLVALVLGLVSTLAISTVPRRRNPPPPDPLTNGEVEVALRRAQITPEALAAAGFSASDVTALIGRARSHLSDHVQSLRDAQAAYARSRRETDRLTRLVRSGLGGPQAASDLAAAQQSLVSTKSTLDAQFEALKVAGLGENTSSSATAALTAIAANSAWDLPVEYRCRTGATEDQWIQLREALADEQISQRQGSQLSDQATQTLTQWRAVTAVATARSNLNSRIDGLRSAWSQAIGQ